MEKKTCSRREFIFKIGTATAALAVFVPVLGSKVFGMGRSIPASAGPITINLTDSNFKALTQTGGALKIPNTFDGGKPIIVVRSSEATVVAFSSKCTHLGCELPLPVNNVITCPCHGAGFTAEGKVTRGPAKKDLTVYPATLEGSVITVSNVAKR
jgi:Rieske Fe-S protein